MNGYQEAQVNFYPQARSMKCKFCGKDYETKCRNSKFCNVGCKKDFIKKNFELVKRFKKDQ